MVRCGRVIVSMDFVCTAMRRPGIVRDAFESFAHNLQGVDLRASRLFINIDPLPAVGSADDVRAIAAEFFGEVIANEPAEPCFPAAVKWCWQQPVDEFFFSLEDDWILREPVDVGKMLELLQTDATLSLVNLRAYPHNDDRLCLAPGLWRTAHARAIADRMRTDANPEMQLRRRRDNNPHGGLHEGYRGMQFPAAVVLKDIGRIWMKVCGMRREGSRNFVRWAS